MEREQGLRGALVFLAITLGGTWLATAALQGGSAGRSLDTPIFTRLLATSLLYGLTMGWQPLLAFLVVRRCVGEHVSAELSPRDGAQGRHSAMAVGLALLLVTLAAVLAWLGASLGLAPQATLHGHAEPELSSLRPTLANALALLVAFVLTVAFLWVQSLGEEVGWRGYFLERLMRSLGPWEGLLLHGAVWGLWYAPVLLLGSGGASQLPTRTVGSAMVTCTLLGVFLGGLKLAFRSVVPATVANVTITLAAGLPYVLVGVDAGLRSAVFGPAGWVATTVLCALLYVLRGRELFSLVE